MITNNSRVIALQKDSEEWGEELDGADLFTVFSILIDSTGDSFSEFRNSSLYKDILGSTQSNYEKSDLALQRMFANEAELLQLGEMDPNAEYDPDSLD